MKIEQKVKTHFTNLIEDEVFSTTYFLNKSYDNYNVEELNQLQNKVAIARKKYHFTLNLLSLAQFIDDKKLMSKTALRLENKRKNFLRCSNELEIFESNLAYLILSGKIKSAEKLGFSSEYIKNLLHTKNRELKDSVVEYHYDSSTYKTSKVVNGKLIILPYIPKVVEKEKYNQKSKYRVSV